MSQASQPPPILGTRDSVQIQFTAFKELPHALVLKCWLPINWMTSAASLPQQLENPSWSLTIHGVDFKPKRPDGVEFWNGEELFAILLYIVPELMAFDSPQVINDISQMSAQVTASDVVGKALIREIIVFWKKLRNQYPVSIADQVWKYPENSNKLEHLPIQMTSAIKYVSLYMDIYKTKYFRTRLGNPPDNNIDWNRLLFEIESNKFQDNRILEIQKCQDPDWLRRFVAALYSKVLYYRKESHTRRIGQAKVKDQLKEQQSDLEKSHKNMERKHQRLKKKQEGLVRKNKKSLESPIFAAELMNSVLDRYRKEEVIHRVLLEFILENPKALDFLLSDINFRHSIQNQMDVVQQILHRVSKRYLEFKLFCAIPFSGGSFRGRERAARAVYQNVKLQVNRVKDEKGSDLVLERTSHRRKYDDQIRNVADKLDRDFVRYVRRWIKSKIPSCYTHGLNDMKLNGIAYHAQSAHAIAYYPNMRAMTLLNTYLNDTMLITYLQPDFYRDIMDAAMGQGVAMVLTDSIFQRIYGETIPNIMEKLQEKKKEEEEMIDLWDIYQGNLTNFVDWLSDPDQPIHCAVDDFNELCKQSSSCRANLLAKKKISNEKLVDSDGDIQMKDLDTSDINYQHDNNQFEQIDLGGPPSLTMEDYKKARQQLVSKFHFSETKYMNFQLYCKRITAGSSRLKAAIHGYLPVDHRYSPSACDLDELQSETMGFKNRREMDAKPFISPNAKRIMPEMINKPKKLCGPDMRCIHLESSRLQFKQQLAAIEKALNENKSLVSKDFIPAKWGCCTLYHLALLMEGDEDLSNGLKTIGQRVFQDFQAGIEPVSGVVLQSTRDMEIGEIIGLLMGDLITEEEQKRRNNQYLLNGDILRSRSLVMDSLPGIRMDCNTSSSIARWTWPRCSILESTVAYVDIEIYEGNIYGKVATMRKNMPRNHSFTAHWDANFCTVDGGDWPYCPMICYGLCARCSGCKDYALPNAIFSTEFAEFTKVPGLVNQIVLDLDVLQERIDNDEFWLFPSQTYLNDKINVIGNQYDQKCGFNDGIGDEKQEEHKVESMDISPSSNQSWNQQYRVTILAVGYRHEIEPWYHSLETDNPFLHQDLSIESNDEQWTSDQLKHAQDFRDAYPAILLQKSPAAQIDAVRNILNPDICHSFEPRGDINATFMPLTECIWDSQSHFDYLNLEQRVKWNQWTQEMEQVKYSTDTQKKKLQDDHQHAIARLKKTIKGTVENVMKQDQEYQQWIEQLSKIDLLEKEFEEEKKKIIASAKSQHSRDKLKWKNQILPQLQAAHAKEKEKKNQDDWKPQRQNLNRFIDEKEMNIFHQLMDNPSNSKLMQELEEKLTNDLKKVMDDDEEQRNNLIARKPRSPKNQMKQVIIYRKTVTLMPQIGTLDGQMHYHVREGGNGGFIDRHEQGVPTVHCGVAVLFDEFGIKCRAQSNQDTYCTFNMKLLPIKPSLSQKPVVSIGLGLFGKVESSTIDNSDNFNPSLYYDGNDNFKNVQSDLQKNKLRNRDAWCSMIHAVKNFMEQSKLAIYIAETDSVLPLQLHVLPVSDAAAIKDMNGFQNDTIHDHYMTVCNVFQGSMESFLLPSSHYDSIFPLNRIQCHESDHYVDLFRYLTDHETRECVGKNDKKWILVDGLPSLWHHADSIMHPPCNTHFLMTATPDSLKWIRETFLHQVFPLRFGANWSTEMSAEECFRKCKLGLRNIPWQGLGITTLYRDPLHGVIGFGNCVFNADIQIVVDLTPPGRYGALQVAVKQMFDEVNKALKTDFPAVYNSNPKVFDKLCQHVMSYVKSLPQAVKKGNLPPLFRAEMMGETARCWLFIAHHATSILLEHVIALKLGMLADNQFANVDKAMIGHILNGYTAQFFRYLLAIQCLFYQQPKEIRESDSTRRFLIGLHHKICYLNRLCSSSFSRVSTLYRYMASYLPCFLMCRRDLHPSIYDSRHAEKGNQINKRSLLRQTNCHHKHIITGDKYSPCQMAQAEQITHNALFLAVLRSLDFSFKANSERHFSQMAHPQETFEELMQYDAIEMMKDVLKSGTITENLRNDKLDYILDWCEWIAMSIQNASDNTAFDDEISAPVGQEESLIRLIQCLGKPILAIPPKSKSRRPLATSSRCIPRQDIDRSGYNPRLPMGHQGVFCSISQTLQDYDDNQSEQWNHLDQQIPSIMSMEAAPLFPIDANRDTIIACQEGYSIDNQSGQLLHNYLADTVHQMMEMDNSRQSDNDDDDDDDDDIILPKLSIDMCQLLEEFTSPNLPQQQRRNLLERYQERQEEKRDILSLEDIVHQTLDKMESMETNPVTDLISWQRAMNEKKQQRDYFLQNNQIASSKTLPPADIIILDQTTPTHVHLSQDISLTGKRSRIVFENEPQGGDTDDDCEFQIIPSLPPAKKFKRTPPNDSIIDDSTQSFMTKNVSWFGPMKNLGKPRSFLKLTNRIALSTKSKQDQARKGHEDRRYLAPTIMTDKFCQTMGFIIFVHFQLMLWWQHPNSPQCIYQKWKKNKPGYYIRPWCQSLEDLISDQKNKKKKREKSQEQFCNIYSSDCPDFLKYWENGQEYSIHETHLWGGDVDNANIEVRKPTDRFIPIKIGAYESEFLLIHRGGCWNGCPMLYDDKSRLIQFPRDPNSTGNPFYSYPNTPDGHQSYDHFKLTQDCINFDFDRPLVPVELTFASMTNDRCDEKWGFFAHLRWLKRYPDGEQLWKQPLISKPRYDRDSAILSFVNLIRRNLWRITTLKCEDIPNKHLHIPYQTALTSFYLMDGQAEQILNGSVNPFEQDWINPNEDDDSDSESEQEDEQMVECKGKEEKMPEGNNESDPDGKTRRSARIRNKMKKSEGTTNQSNVSTPVKRGRGRGRGGRGRGSTSRRGRGGRKQLLPKSNSESKKTKGNNKKTTNKKKKKNRGDGSVDENENEDEADHGDNEEEDDEAVSNQVSNDNPEDSNPETAALLNRWIQLLKFKLVVTIWLTRTKHLTPGDMDVMSLQKTREDVMNVFTRIYCGDYARDYIPTDTETEEDDVFTSGLPITELNKNDQPIMKYRQLLKEYGQNGDHRSREEREDDEKMELVTPEGLDEAIERENSASVDVEMDQPD